MVTVVVKKFQELNKHSSPAAHRYSCVWQILLLHCIVIVIVLYYIVIVIVLYCGYVTNLLKPPKLVKSCVRKQFKSATLV